MKSCLEIQILIKQIFIKLLAVICLVLPAQLPAQDNSNQIRNELGDPGLPRVEKIKQLNNLARKLNKDSTNQALVYGHEAYLLSLNQSDKKLQVASLLNLSEGYLYNDIYEQALQYGYSALDLAEKTGDTLLLADCNTNLGWVFFDAENTSFAMQYHREAYYLNMASDRKKQIALSLNAIGLIFQLRNENDSAKIYFEKALMKAREEKMNATISATLNNLGICENYFGRYREALSYFENALSIKSNSSDLLAVAETQNQMAFSYLKIKNYTLADSLLKNSRSLINKSTSNSRKEKLLDNLHISSQLYEGLGQYEKAFENLREYTKVSNQIISRNKMDVVATMKLKRESQDKENQIKELNLSRDLRVFQRNAFIAGMILLIIIGFLLYRSMRQVQKRRNDQEEFKQKMIQQDLQNTVTEKEVLNSKLEYKNADLKYYALYISQRNELIRVFIEELKLLGVQDIKKENTPEFNKVIRKFQQNLEINSDAQEFNESVDEMHKDFFFNLMKKFPGLTDNERRLCAQIRLNLSIKEIASINNISVKSVEMARYRLRKQLNLQTGEDLNEFLKAF
ncbi:MAG: tetratricopeptide repeat protein [Ginsengibacter sp.]